MISITGLNKRYRTAHGPVDALRDIDLTVDSGDIFGIIGLSGAGKSTLIRCLNRLEEPDSGSIVVAGKELVGLDRTALREARKKIGMIFQHFNLLDSRTVFDNVAFPLELAGLSKREIGPRVDEILELVGLHGRKQSYPSQLSGGQKQRVGIARALANHPDLLLCDEATSALDPQTTASILDLLADVNRKLGVTIVLITHEMQVIRQICNKVAVLDQGCIVESGNVVDVFNAPRSSTMQLFLTHSTQQGNGSGI